MALVATVLPATVGGPTRWSLLVVGAALMAATVGAALMLPWDRYPRWTQIGPPLVFLVDLAILRDAAGGTGSGLAPLVLAPVLWLGLYGSRAESALACPAAVAALVAPAYLGAGEYALGQEWRTAAAVGVVAIGSSVALHSVRAHLDRQVRAALDAEAKLASIFAGATETAIVVFDIRGAVTAFSPGAERLLGYDASEIVGRGPPYPWASGDELAPLDVHDPVDVARTLEQLATRPLVRELAVIRKDGGTLRMSVAVTAVTDAKGAPVGGVAYATDVTALREAQRHAAEQAARLEAVLNAAAGLAVIAADAGGRVDVFSGGAERMLGRGADEVLGMRAVDLADLVFDADDVRAAADAAGVEDCWQALFTLPGRAWEVRRPNGTRLRATASSGSIGDGGGRVVVLVDVSERERLLAEVHAARERLQGLVANAPGPIFAKDLDLRFTLVNPATEVLLGAPAGEIVGRAAHELFPPDVAAPLEANDRIAIESRRTIQFEERVPGADGSVRTFLTVKFPLLDARGAPFGVSGIATDITDRVAAEGQLRAARDAAENASVAKSEFLSRISHELRTPLNSVLGFAHVLQAELRGEAERAHAAHIARGGEHLLRLIDDLLDLARIESGREIPDMTPIDVVAVVREALELVGPLFDERRLELRVDAHRGLYRHVLADGRRLRQVLINLLANAVRYNVEGGWVAVRFADGGAAGRLRILVVDSGPGIGPGDATRIFDAFARGGGSGAPVGTGLGLALSREIARSMGGDVGFDAESAETTFWVELREVTPAEGTAGTAAPVAAAWPARDGDEQTVLYIEDEPANAELMKVLLAARPRTRLVVAEDGRSGLDAVEAEEPDVVLLDANLPDMRGEEVLARLHGTVPVVVVTADATPERLQALRAAGAEACLTKPLEVHALVEHVEHALGAIT